MMLAYTGAVKEGVIDIEELSCRLMELLNKYYPETLKERYKENHWRFSETIFVHQLPLIMDRLNLKRLQTNNEIKKQYGIDGKGFPTLYVRKGN